MSKFEKVIETRVQKMSWGATWVMCLEKWVSTSGKTTKYIIYHTGGQSYHVQTTRTIKAAVKTLDSFSNYSKVAA